MVFFDLNNLELFVMKFIDPDTIILRKVEAFAHWFQDWFGKDNFWLAEFFVGIEVMFGSAVAFYMYFYEGQDQYDALSVLVSSGIMAFILYLSINIARTMHLKSGGKFRNLLETSFAFKFVRFSTFCYAFFNSGHYLVGRTNIFNFGLPVLLAMIFYLISCTPKPPSESKFKEWLAGIFRAKSPAYAS